MRLGEYTVEDFMLGVNKRDVFGIYFEGNRGPKIDINDFKIINQGGVIYNINNVFSSYRFSGTTEYHICLIDKWLEYSGKTSAMLEFGFRCPKGKPTFYVTVWGEADDNNKGLRIKLSGWSWDKEYF